MIGFHDGLPMTFRVTPTNSGSLRPLMGRSTSMIPWVRQQGRRHCLGDWRTRPPRVPQERQLVQYQLLVAMSCPSGKILYATSMLSLPFSIP